MSKEVWIIGADPPCPRCDLARQRTRRISYELNASFRFLKYNDPEAKAFARSLGKETGMPKHVAEKAGINIDWDHVHALVANPPNPPEDIAEVVGKARLWSPEMDETIRPCQEKADSVGILMTPILVVDGQVKHHGSVPSIEQVRSWLT